MASRVEIAGWAYDAGLRNPAKLAQAVAIAEAESGGNPGKLGDLTLQTATWGPSVGLWQIRSLKAEKGKGGIRDADKLTDPAFNARSMVQISKSGSDWSSWSVTHLSNPAGRLRFQAALPLAVPAVTQMLTEKGASQAAGAAQDAASTAVEPITQLAGVLHDAVETPVRLANWMTEPGVWVRISYLLIGAALVTAGAWTIASKPTLAAVGQVAKTVVPVGKAGKIIGKAGKAA